MFVIPPDAGDDALHTVTTADERAARTQGAKAGKAGKAGKGKGGKKKKGGKKTADPWGAGAGAGAGAPDKGGAGAGAGAGRGGKIQRDQRKGSTLNGFDGLDSKA